MQRKEQLPRRDTTYLPRLPTDSMATIPISSGPKQYEGEVLEGFVALVSYVDFCLPENVPMVIDDLGSFRLHIRRYVYIKQQLLFETLPCLRQWLRGAYFEAWEGFRAEVQLAETSWTEQSMTSTIARQLSIGSGEVLHHASRQRQTRRSVSSSIGRVVTIEVSRIFQSESLGT